MIYAVYHGSNGYLVRDYQGMFASMELLLKNMWRESPMDADIRDLETHYLVIGEAVENLKRYYASGVYVNFMRVVFESHFIAMDGDRPMFTDTISVLDYISYANKQK